MKELHYRCAIHPGTQSWDRTLINKDMNNFYFLNLDIPLFKEGITFHDITKVSIAILDEEKYLNEKIFMLLDSLGLKIFFVETFFKTPDKPSGIHIDASGGDYTKLNWVFGGGDSKMGWFEPIDKKPKLISKNTAGKPFVSYAQNEVTEIERTVVKNPTLIQVGLPHNVFDVTEERFCVSILFKHKSSDQRPTMNESVQIFKKYIEDTSSE